MGWCSATVIFDTVADALIGDGAPKDVETALRTLIVALQDGDWDCECESEYWDHPIVRKIFEDLGQRDKEET
jgi:hypothetical protein